MPLPEIFRDCLRDLSLTPNTQPAQEVPKLWLQQLRPLGHELCLFQAASNALIQRLAKQRLSAELMTFLQPWLPDTGPETPTASFRLLLGETSTGWRLMDGTVPWVNDHRWAALLHLPGLRSHWQTQIRAAHLEHLQQILPAAWLLDDTTMPPGSVIAGLGITGWANLATNGGHFQLQDAAGTITEFTASDAESVWQEKLNHAIHTGRSILSHTAAPTAWLMAHYARHDEKILLSHAWKSDAEGTSKVF